MKVFGRRWHPRAQLPPLNSYCRDIISIHILSHCVNPFHVHVILALLPIREGVVIEVQHFELQKGEPQRHVHQLVTVEVQLLEEAETIASIIDQMVHSRDEVLTQLQIFEELQVVKSLYFG